MRPPKLAMNEKPDGGIYRSGCSVSNIGLGWVVLYRENNLCLYHMACLMDACTRKLIYVWNKWTQMSQTWFRIVKNGKFASRTYKICKTLVKFVSPKKIIHTSLKVKSWILELVPTEPESLAWVLLKPPQDQRGSTVVDSWSSVQVFESSRRWH